MKYFHRTHASPDSVIARSATFFTGSLAPVEEGPRRRRFSGPLGHVTVRVEAEGGHHTRVTVETNQPGESELDRLAKRFLSLIHAESDPGHILRGAY